MDACKDFYENIDRENIYKVGNDAETHGGYRHTTKFIENYNLYQKKCLEIGSSKGLFQDLVDDYTGIDIAKSLKKYYHKDFFTINDNGTYPFEDETFDAVWTYAVFEHIPDIDQALNELKRVLKKDGYVMFTPAWNCRPWAAEGYKVRPYSDFGFFGKLIKASIPIRDHILWRSAFIFPKRLIRHLMFIFGKRYKKLPLKKLKPNYEKFWVSDSDAINNIDPHDAILWFESNGFKCISHPMNLKAFFVRTGSVIFQKK